MSWADDVDGAAKRVVQRVSRFHRKVVLDVFSEVIERTPVDTGRARGNWQATIGQPAAGQTGIEDKSGLTAKNEARSVSNTIQLDQDAWLSNNLPYIERLEYGWSKQSTPEGNSAAQGMVRVTVARWEQFLQKNKGELG